MEQNFSGQPKWIRQQKRYFSDSFKIQKVKEIDNKQTTVRQLCKLHEVSTAAVYKWLNKYSVYNKQKVRLIVEPMSDSHKIEELQKRIRELERMVGLKQIELEFKEKMIEIAEEMYGVDIKKKLGSSLSGGSRKTGKDTEEK